MLTVNQKRFIRTYQNEANVSGRLALDTFNLPEYYNRYRTGSVVVSLLYRHILRYYGFDPTGRFFPESLDYSHRNIVRILLGSGFAGREEII